MSRRERGLGLVILAFFAWFFIVLPGVGCGTTVGSQTTGDEYVGDSCYYAGFYDSEVNGFYDTIFYNYDIGISYYYQNLDAEDTCDYYCGYDDQCYYDCVDCLYGIVDDVYLY